MSVSCSVSKQQRFTKVLVLHSFIGIFKDHLEALFLGNMSMYYAFFQHTHIKERESVKHCYFTSEVSNNHVMGRISVILISVFPHSRFPAETALAHNYYDLG